MECDEGGSTDVERVVPGPVRKDRPHLGMRRGQPRGVKPEGKCPRVSVPSRGHRLGKIGRVNASESSMTPRHCHFRRRVVSVGDRGRPLEGGRCRPEGLGRSGAHHRPRGSEDTHPGRISSMRNVTTPMGSGGTFAGRPTVRKAETPSGRRKTREANAGGRKAAENRDRTLAPPPAVLA